jgi:hypothetical protein
MQLLDALITFVSQTLSAISKSNLTVFEQPKVMLSTFSISSANDFAALLLNYYLCFQCMSFLLT